MRREEFVKRARRQQERTLELPPRRGAILDTAGRPLAVSALVDSIFAIPSDLDDPSATASALSRLLGLKEAELLRKLSDHEKEFVWIARRVPEETVRRVKAKNLTGVRFLKESTRRYPEGPLAASLLGYVGADNQGLAGLEFRYDGVVRGRPARVTVLRDAAQRSYAVARRAPGAVSDQSVEGASLVLTLDSSIQHVADRELARAAEAAHAKSGSAIVMDASTGAVLALASWPSFDPNRYAESEPEERRCRPVADTYEPGSTFKVITAAAALDAGTVAPDDMIDCGGGVLTIGKTTIHEHGKNRWGVLSLTDVLAHSSNIGIAHVALGLGRGAFHRTVRAFGFGQKTGLDVEGESSGLFRDPSSWSALTLPTMSFGQEIGVTALQMARAFAAVANDGVVPVPYLVSEVQHVSGVVEKRRPKGGEQAISKETAATLRRLLVRVVESGTGKLAAVPGFTVGGKTGTAQKAHPGGGYSRDRFVASFFGFLPAESPRVVIAVVVDEPKGKIYGGDVAAPAFAAIGSETMRILRVPARPAETRVTPSVLTADLRSAAAVSGRTGLGADLVPAARREGRAARGGERSREATGPSGEKLVPDLSGLPSREAVRLLASAGLDARLTGHGFVVSQDPHPGTPAVRGATCLLALALEPAAADGAAAVAAEGTR